MSSLLPLEIPVGRPILSCNATDLQQAIISLDGTLYNCHRSSITLSCPRQNTQYSVVDRCLGRTLNCDDAGLRRRMSSRKVSCTNGTLISDHSITCKSAHLTQTKSILNCVFTENDGDDDRVNNVEQVTTWPDNVSVLPLQTTSESNSAISTTLSPFDEDYGDTDLFDVRVGEEEGSALSNDLRRTLRKVFPSSLLSISSQHLVLPPANSLNTRSENHKIPGNLKTSLDGIFPHELLAISRLTNSTASGQGLSSTSKSTSTTRGQRRTTTRFPPLYVRVEDDDNDRHIFSP